MTINITNLKKEAYLSKSTKREINVAPKKVTPSITKTKKQMSDNLLRHSVQHMSNKKPLWRCHQCERHGHIRPYCYRLHVYPKIHDHSGLRASPMLVA
jgi:hypothetical protein